jgi:hypothetical protein
MAVVWLSPMALIAAAMRPRGRGNNHWRLASRALELVCRQARSFTDPDLNCITGWPPRRRFLARCLPSHALYRYCYRHLLELQRGTMTGDQSRGLKIGARVCWGEDKNDQGIVTEKNWSGVTLKWDNRDRQSVLHNDMQMVFLIPEK